jgi:HSP20 family molecular chaperone IbpA
MKASQPVTQPASPPPRPSNGCEPVAFHDLTDCLLEAYDAVAQRAYEIFRERGSRQGGELLDWRRAEKDVLQRLTVDLQESEHAVTALASVPGCTAQQLEVGVESDWMVIHGWFDDPNPLNTRFPTEYEGFGPGAADWNLEGIDRSFIRPSGSASQFSPFPPSFPMTSSDDSHSPNHPHSHLCPDHLLQCSGRSAFNRQMFAVLRLPAPVDQSRSCAFLHDGLLGIRMLKNPLRPASPVPALRFS